jgi:hypothetical protein
MANSNNHGGTRPGAGRKKKNPDGTFEHTTFTAEQLKELTDSPHVAYVSSKSVSYTKAFKDMQLGNGTAMVLIQCKSLLKSASTRRH